MAKFCFPIILLVCFLSVSCKEKNQSQPPAEESDSSLIARTKASFKPVLGIHYTEVYRRFANNISFNAQGYQLKPSWKFYFVADTTVALYSDIKNRYYDLPVTLDHDSLFNMGSAWFRAKKIAKDSLKFQVLEVKNKVINWKNANVYVTFYAEDYLKKQHLDLEKLRQTTKRDTEYVKALALASSRDPKKIFAAQQPVMLTSKSPDVIVTNAKLKAKILNSYYIPETLFYPEYSITINKAYADFNHAFAVKINASGQMQFIEPMEAMIDPDDQQNTIKIMKGIMDGYLAHYLQITPGRTLGIPHDSLILLAVRGHKS